MDDNNFISEEEDGELFPWDDVNACLERVLDGNKFKGHNSCPKCGLDSEKLIWIDFESPEWTWEHLCGSQGPLSICPICKIQVEFILETMN